MQTKRLSMIPAAEIPTSTLSFDANNPNNGGNDDENVRVDTSLELRPSRKMAPPSKALEERPSFLNYLIGVLLFFVVLNIFLILWIMISLNLHQNSSFLRKQNSLVGHRNRNDFQQFRINGDLITTAEDNQTLYTNLIEDLYTPKTLDNVHHSDWFPVLPEHYLQIKSSNGQDLVLTSDNRGMRQSMSDLGSSLRLKSNNGNIEMRINRNLLIKSDQPKRSLLVEPDRLVIEDTTTMPYLHREMGGLNFQQLNTDSLIGCVDQDFRIESRTETLKIQAQDSIQLQSNHGDICLDANENVRLNVREDGQLNLQSKMISFANLNVDRQHTHHRHRHHHNHHQQQSPTGTAEPDPSLNPKTYQVCICSNGQLFMAEETTLCKADRNICSSLDQ